MSNICAICGTKQVKDGTLTFTLSMNDKEKSFESPSYNISLHTFIKGHHICERCMDIYRKIKALEYNIDFSTGSEEYYADGRNLYKDSDL